RPLLPGRRVARWPPAPRPCRAGPPPFAPPRPAIRSPCGGPRGRWCTRRISRMRARYRYGSRAAHRRSISRSAPRSRRPAGTAWRAAAPSASASEAADLAPRERAADPLVHAPPGELLGGAVERVGGVLDRAVIRAFHQLLERLRGALDDGCFLRRQEMAIGLKRLAGGFQQASSLDALLGERPRMDVLPRVLERVPQHALDVGVGEPIRRLDRDGGLRTRGIFLWGCGGQALG